MFKSDQHQAQQENRESEEKENASDMNRNKCLTLLNELQKFLLMG